MPIEQLEKLMRESELDTRSREIISTEINARLLKALAKPHWSLTPLFWVSVVGAVAAVVAAYYAYLAYSQPQQSSVANPQSQNEPSTLQKPSPRNIRGSDLEI